MKITRLKGPEVRLELSADDWQLYGLEGREEVAQKLNREMEERIRNAPARRDFKLEGLLTPYRDYGAADSEGFHTVEYILSRVYPYTDLTDII